MKKDNRGFTLVELIVSIAIFTIVAAAAYGFMVAGASSYSSVSGTLNRQLRAQMIFGQIENRLVDCNAAIYAPENKLYIVNKSDMDAAKYDVYVYELKTDGTLYYGKHDSQTLTLQNGKLSAESVSGFGAAEVLSQKVANFAAAKKLSSTADSVTKVQSVEITLALRKSKDTNTAAESQIVALRNDPQWLG